MNLQPDGSASQQTHFDTCSGAPSRRAWTGEDWVEPDPVFRVNGTSEGRCSDVANQA
jgi:hypothetical protein